MSYFYGDEHRKLQDHFETRELADRLEAFAQPVLDDMAKAFITSRDFFFLATVDHQGRPTVSYKGGAPGFIRIVDDSTLAFPSLDGNGMYLSMGNIATHAEIGMLLIDFEHPQRLRIQGTASVSADDPLRAEFQESELVVRVKVQQAFINCPRYIHRHERVESSRYVPQAGTKTPFAQWKRIDMFSDALAPRDQAKIADNGGLITFEDYLGLAAQGDG